MTGSAFAILPAVVTAASLVQSYFAWRAVDRHRKQELPRTSWEPPITILKPLHGDEPMLEQALASFCDQDYRNYQIVFGLQDAGDPALDVIRRLRTRFPDVDIAVVIDRTQHGVNRKVSNLINMYSAAKHGVIVVADSDIHVSRDYLLHLAAEMGRKGVGLVTVLYFGISASNSLAARLGIAQINYNFLPGVLLGRVFGRQDCLGGTMALRRETLEAIGGLHALVHHLADDNMLGRLVAARGDTVAIAATLTATTVPEVRISDLFAHEVRWGRTIRSLAPVGFALSALQYPTIWAALAIVTSQGEIWAVWLLITAWLGRAVAMRGVETALGLQASVPIWILPLRDALSITLILASFGGSNVTWRGHVLRVRSPDRRRGADRRRIAVRDRFATFIVQHLHRLWG